MVITLDFLGEIYSSAAKNLDFMRVCESVVMNIGTTTSEEASIVPFPPRGENCTMLASSTYDGYSVSFGEGYEFHGWITYTWVIPIKGRPTKGR